MVSMFLIFLHFSPLDTDPGGTLKADPDSQPCLSLNLC